MTNNLFLNWLLISTSLINTILLIWLGATVLLNAEERTWGLWFAGLGLLLGAVFFISHTSFLVVGPLRLSWVSTIFWWVIGIVPAISLPFLWYVVMLWYAGFWTGERSALQRRQGWWLWITAVIMLGGIIVAIVATALLATPIMQFTQLRFFIRFSVAGIPLLAVGYSIYLILCIGLALDAVRRPGPAKRLMGSEARERARPGLITASVCLFVVSLIVTGVLVWIVQDASQRLFLEIYLANLVMFALIDLIVSLILTVAIISLGQAVVSYEIFTGQTLPRRGLLRHWQRVLLLAVGYGTLVSATVAIQLRPSYIVTLGTVLMTLFYALFGWQSYTERERMMRQLRPFIASQRLYDQLITPSAPATQDIVPAFAALCREVIGAEVGYLIPVGSLAPLVGAPVSFPDKRPLPPLEPLQKQFKTAQTRPLPIDPDLYGEATWAISLWSERGLIGLLLLGAKRDNGLYSQEDLEIARVSGERLLDTQASAEMSRRLMGLQRERLAQTQIIDQQTRRVLHDDILPTLQTAMIALSNEQPSANGKTAESMTLLTDAHRQISDLLRNMPTTSVPDVANAGLLRAVRRTVENEFAVAFDAVVWEISDEAETAVRQLPTLTAETLFYATREAIRNAARYGRVEEGKRPFRLCLAMQVEQGELSIRIEDNGVGVATKTPNLGGGQGLALHSTMMAVIGGALEVESVEREFTAVLLTLPLS